MEKGMGFNVLWAQSFTLINLQTLKNKIFADI